MMRPFQDQIDELKRGNQGDHLDKKGRTYQLFCQELLITGLPSKFLLLDMNLMKELPIRLNIWKPIRALWSYMDIQMQPDAKLSMLLLLKLQDNSTKLCVPELFLTSKI